MNRLGDEHRNDYGNTLIDMITGRTKPSDLLSSTTTMTCEKKVIKERIMMIAKKPKMLLPTLLVVILLVSVAASCTFSGAGNTNTKNEITPLTVKELDYFNGDEFFNGEPINIRNQFLGSLYDDPKNIDLFQLFYCGIGLAEKLTDAEREAVIAYNNWAGEPDCACAKISHENMNAVLTQYTGLTVAETEKTGLDNFTYLEEYDAYYIYHGDTNYRGKITFNSGEREGNIIRLFYEDTYMGDGEKVLTLQEKNEGYLFVSNLKKGSVEESVSVSD